MDEAISVFLGNFFEENRAKNSLKCFQGIGTRIIRKKELMRVRFELRKRDLTRRRVVNTKLRVG